MEQVEAVGHAEIFQLLQGPHRLGHRQPEFRAVSARRFPAPRSAAGKFDAQPDRRPHTYTLAVFQNQVQLRVLLHHRDDLAPHLLGEHGHLDVLIILEAVADDRGLIVGQRHHEPHVVLHEQHG